MENRKIRYVETELRTAMSDTNEMIVEGYALKFEKEGSIGGSSGYVEKFDRRSLDSADMTDVVFTTDHKGILAGTRNNSLKLTVDDIGLKISARFVDTTDARNTYALITSGLITKMSFAFSGAESEWTFARGENTLDLRNVKSIGKLHDVSAVVHPAYEDTSISARSSDIQDYKKSIYDSQIQKLNKILGGI